jgi:hypothetical protein
MRAAFALAAGKGPLQRRTPRFEKHLFPEPAFRRGCRLIALNLQSTIRRGFPNPANRGQDVTRSLLRFLLLMHRGKNPLLQNSQKMRLYFAKRQTHTQGRLDIGHRGPGLEVLR